MSTQDADHVVRVTCDMANFQLQIDTPSLTVLLGQTVVWSFTGVPDGWVPQLSPDLGQVLPFESVASTATRIWGRGARAGFGSVTYRVSLQCGAPVEIWGNSGGALLFSPGVTLLEHGQPSDEEPFTFEVSGVPAGEPTLLVVAPTSLTIRDGDTVTWNFNPSCFPDGVNPSDCTLNVMFTQFTPDSGNEPLPNLPLGPFEMLTMTNTETVHTVVGIGNNDIKGIYGFQVCVIDENGNGIRWSSTEDPSIDNRDGGEG